MSADVLMTDWIALCVQFNFILHDGGSQWLVTIKLVIASVTIHVIDSLDGSGFQMMDQMWEYCTK